MAEDSEKAAESLQDEDTIHQSGNTRKKQSSKKKKKSSSTTEEKLAKAKAQIADEKAGKRKLFHSLVKLANELRRVRMESSSLVAQRDFEEQSWYHGGIWRSPVLLPAVMDDTAVRKLRRTSRLPAVSLLSLMLSLVIVTALTRVGVVISQNGYIDGSQTIYFAIFVSIWMKDSEYSTRFDTSDLSATIVTLGTCFAVLFAILSVPHPMDAPESSMIFLCAAFCAGIHSLLHIRLALTGASEENPEISQQVAVYAMFNMIFYTVEMALYLIIVFVFESDFEWRWLFVLGALLASVRLPRVFLPDDFQGMFFRLRTFGRLYAFLSSVFWYGSWLFETQCSFHSPAWIFAPKRCCCGKRVL